MLVDSCTLIGEAARIDEAPDVADVSSTGTYAVGAAVASIMSDVGVFTRFSVVATVVIDVVVVTVNYLRSGHSWYQWGFPWQKGELNSAI